MQIPVMDYSLKSRPPPSWTVAKAQVGTWDVLRIKFAQHVGDQPLHPGFRAVDSIFFVNSKDELKIVEEGRLLGYWT